METAAADIILTQEVKIPDGHLREQAEQSARNAKWSLAIEPCNVSSLGGMSVGTAVAVGSFICMSEVDAVNSLAYDTTAIAASPHVAFAFEELVMEAEASSFYTKVAPAIMTWTDHNASPERTACRMCKRRFGGCIPVQCAGANPA